MSADSFVKAKNALLDSKVISFPTETVMGLGVFFDDEKAYNLLNQIKRRPEDKPYTLMVCNKEEVSKYAYLTERDMKIVNAFMPGPVTLLLKSKDNIPSYVTHNTHVIGIRVPDIKEICDMIAYVGKPLLVPSANRSGEKPCLTHKEVSDVFGDELGYIYPKDALDDDDLFDQLNCTRAAINFPCDHVNTMWIGGEISAVTSTEATNEMSCLIIDTYAKRQGGQVVSTKVKATTLRIVSQSIIHITQVLNHIWFQRDIFINRFNNTGQEDQEAQVFHGVVARL